MNAYEELTKCIQWVLDNKSSYRIAQDLEIPNRMPNRYQNGETPLANMSLKTAKTIYEFYKGEFEMENKINEIITGVENGKVELGGDKYDVEGYVNHAVVGSELEVYFEEKEHGEEPNGLDDMYNYDKVVAYDAGDGIVWL